MNRGESVAGVQERNHKVATVTVEHISMARAGIEQSNRAFEAALTAGDAAAVAANYTATARILPPNQPAK